MIRKDRKKIIHQNGIENYCFDYNKELRIYLFLCGERLSKKEYKKLQDNEKMYTYAEWKSYIRNKYIKYSINALKEFSKYLNHRGRLYSPEREFINPMVSAIVSAFISFIITQYSMMANIGSVSVAFGIVMILVVLFMGIFAGYFIVKISEIFFDNSIKENLFKDYKEIIDDIIIEKERSRKQGLTTDIQ